MAAPVVYNLALPSISTFDNVITGTGASVTTAKVTTGASVFNYVDLNGNAATVTVTRTLDGSAAAAGGGYSSNGQSLSGSVWDISPSTAGGAGGGANGKPDIDGYHSGLTFTFSSPVNAFGFEIGDWATCCTGGNRSAAVQNAYGVGAQGSGLWIAFDGGAATLPANALSANDNPGYAQFGSFTNFIGAIDSSSTFSKITFFGDGFGEFLVAGGTLRFASVKVGSVGNLPEPGSIALVGLAIAGLAAARRRKAA
ncbi:MAG: PEP-CTERM sorting domain-containing protein [Burkholderiales bacterium]|nr:MAG: PEP-CTERM sorting domain-containing protein [Burkholderiales bacterium]